MKKNLLCSSSKHTLKEVKKSPLEELSLIVYANYHNTKTPKNLVVLAKVLIFLSEKLKVGVDKLHINQDDADKINGPGTYNIRVRKELYLFRQDYKLNLIIVNKGPW